MSSHSKQKILPSGKGSQKELSDLKLQYALEIFFHQI